MAVSERDRLMEVAVTLFAAGGAEEASLSQIAADVGLAVEELSTHFTDFDHLFVAAIDWGLRELRSDLEDLAAASKPPEERLLLITHRLGALTSHEGLALFAFMRELLDGTDRAGHVYSDVLATPLELLLGVIGEAQFRGALTPLPPRFVATQMLCAVVVPQLLGIAGLDAVLQGVHARPDDANVNDVRTKPKSALLAASIQTLFHGLMARPQ